MSLSEVLIPFPVAILAHHLGGSTQHFCLVSTFQAVRSRTARFMESLTDCKIFRTHQFSQPKILPQAPDSSGQPSIISWETIGCLNLVSKKSQPHSIDDNIVRVRGAQQNNLRSIDLDLPRNAFVVFTGVSGSGKSSIAFGTIYAEAQRRYFESIAPYARRLLSQLPAPRVSEITGLPPAVALQQRRGEPTARSSVGTLTTLSNSLRMLFSRAGTYGKGTTKVLDSDAFSPNTPEGACSTCHGMGVVHSVSEESLVPDPSLTIREGAVAAWPRRMAGQELQRHTGDARL